jgi:hypothetical protein
MKLVRGQTKEAAGPMVTAGVVATVTATVAAEVVDPGEEGSEGTESLVIICARKTALYTGDSWWPTIDSHVSQEEGNMNIYVGNLSLDVTEEELRREFMAFGEVISVTIMNDKYIGSGQLRGYGFVETASKSEGEAAIASLKGKTLRGRVIDVVAALPLSDKRGIESLHGRRDNQFSRKGRQRRY